MKMKLIGLYIFSLISCLSISSAAAQNLQDLSFGEDSTFEVATWNLEWFPKNGQTTIDSVALIIQSLEIDVFAIQEIDDGIQFNVLINSLPGWDGFYINDVGLKLGYIYDTSAVAVSNIYKIYPNNGREFPRPPLVMELTWQGEDIIVINNHLKCCGNGTVDLMDEWDEETRRKDATELLDQYIDINFPNKRVVILGDMNDELDDSSPNNVFQNFIDDASNYDIVDMDIANGSSSNWSYPSWPSHLDHVFITSELFTELANPGSEIQVIKVDNFIQGGWSVYDANISDHRPVALKIDIDVVPVTTGFYEAIEFSVYPNPSTGIVSISFEYPFPSQALEVYNSLGQLVLSDETSEYKIDLDFSTFGPDGLYLIKIIDPVSKASSTHRVIILQ